MDALSLERLPDLPSYQSCIRSYGRPILPPLILPSEREVYENFRNRAALVENRINEYNEKKRNLMEIVQGLTNAVIEAQNAYKNDITTKNGDSHTHESQEDWCSSTSEKSDLNAMANSQNTFRAGIYYEEIVDDDEEEEENISVILDPNKPKNTSAELSVNCSYGEKNEPVVNDGRWVLPVIRQPSNALDSNAEREICNETRTLELDDTKSPSMLTVILKDGKDIRSDNDSDSVVLSANQSTDLDKYLDSSFEYNHLSESSVLNEDVNEDCHASSVSESSETLVGDSHRSTPEPSFENLVDDENTSKYPLGKSDEKTSINHIDNSPESICSTDSVPFLKSPDNRRPSPINNNNSNTEVGNPKSWLRKILTQVQSKGDAKEVQKLGNLEVKETNKQASRHVRSNSYTLDAPSPVLVLSHAGCNCTNTPDCVTSPHCTSIHSIDESVAVEDKDSQDNYQCLNGPHIEMQSNTQTSESKPSSAFMKPNRDAKMELNGQALVDSVTQPIPLVNDSCMNQPVSDVELNFKEKSVHNESGSEMSLKELYEKFITMREKTFNDLHAEHVKQWKELSEDFERKEKIFRERIITLELANSLNSKLSPGITSDVSSKSTTVHVPKSSLENYASVPSSAVTSQSPSVDLTTVKSPTIAPSSSAANFLPNTSPINASQNSKIHQPFLSTPISLVRSYMTNNNFLSLKKVASEKHHTVDINNPAMQKKFEKVSAAVKGYLTRRLLSTNRVQAILKSLKDCALHAVQLQERASKGKAFTEKDIEFHKEIFRQLVQADTELHNIFFNISTKERMEIISESREMAKQEMKETAKPSPPLPVFELKNEQSSVPPVYPVSQRKLSSATLKALERKQLRLAAEHRPCSVSDVRLRKKASSTRPCSRKRILSPRSCSISPTSNKTYSKAASPNKKTSGSFFLSGHTVSLKPRMGSE